MTCLCDWLYLVFAVADKTDDNNVHGGDDNATEVGRKGKGSSDKGNKPDMELYEWKEYKSAVSFHSKIVFV